MRKEWSCIIVLGAFISCAADPLAACEFHKALGLAGPGGNWTNSSTFNMNTQGTALESAKLLAPDPTNPVITSWKLSTGAKGHSTNTQINTYVSTITTDVDRIA